MHHHGQMQILKFGEHQFIFWKNKISYYDSPIVFKYSKQIPRTQHTTLTIDIDYLC